MSIFDFTPEEMEAIRQADAEIEEYYRKRKLKKNGVGSGGDRHSAAFMTKQRAARTGNPVWEYRMSHNLTQKQLANMMHVTQETVSAMERGKSKISQYVADWLKAHGGTV